jgi:hypothetical protein
MAISNATKVAPFANGDLASAFRSCLSSSLPLSPFYICSEDEEEDENKDKNGEQGNSPDKGRSQTTSKSPPTFFGPSLSNTIHHTLVLTLCRIQGVCLDF